MTTTVIITRMNRPTDQVELLAIENSFEIAGRGPILIPDFSSSPNGWKDRVDSVTLIAPDGRRIEAHAHSR